MTYSPKTEMKKDIFIPFLILLALTLGCSKLRETANSSSNGDGASNSNTESAKTDDTSPARGLFAPGDDAKADIEKMADRFLSQRSFKAKMDGDGKTPMKMDLEFISPDRYRITMANTSEMIIIGKATYMKIGDKWRKMPMPVDSTITDMRDAFNKEGMKWFSEVKYAGEETADGRPAYVYAYHNKGAGAGVGENDSKLWIAKDNGLPIKMEAVYRSGDLKTMTITYDYQTPVTIEAPIP